MKQGSVIGLTLGDINGIGPEIALKAARQKWPGAARIVLIGDSPWSALQRLPAWDPAHTARPAHAVTIWRPDTGLPSPVHKPGHIRADAARAAHAWIVAATHAAMAGRLDAIVTAPICKEGFMRAGLATPGHTELLAALTGTKRYDMMLLSDDFRVTIATRHVPIRAVASHLSRTGIEDTIRMTHDALAWLGLRKRRIAVCGLNPHAGDGGAIGREDQTLVAPAVRAAQQQGVAASGPLPADTVFYQARTGAFDAVVAMYHDQGLAPFKMFAFEKGVNLTLGLPLVRTSPDHGTAFDKAGRNRANPSSMIEAVKLAIRLAGRPNPWRRA
jgi:4-hydroxythreonine-4-phosphate dehydrogenase